MVLFILLFKFALTFKALDETMVCYHSFESHEAHFSSGTVYAKQGGIDFCIGLLIKPWCVKR